MLSTVPNLFDQLEASTGVAPDMRAACRGSPARPQGQHADRALLPCVRLGNLS